LLFANAYGLTLLTGGPVTTYLLVRRTNRFLFSEVEPSLFYTAVFMLNILWVVTSLL